MSLLKNLEKTRTRSMKERSISTIDTVRSVILENKLLSDAEKLQITILTEQAESQRIMSEHLWWVAFGVKFGLVFIALQFFLLIIFFLG